MGSFANFMAVAFIMGLSAGVQAIAARRVGEGRREETASGLNSGLLIALLVAVPWSLILIYFADDLYPFLVDDVDGRRFDNLDPGEDIAFFNQARDAFKPIGFPNGHSSPVHDTWPH